MSFILVAALVLQSLVSGVAGQMEGFPVCAQQCVDKNLSPCDKLDLKCICENQIDEIFFCMQGACSAEDQATTIRFGRKVCEDDGEPLPSDLSSLTVHASSTSSRPTGSTSTMVTASSGFTTTSVPASTTLPPTFASSTPSSSPVATSSGITVGAAAGIGVGVTLAVFLVAALIFFLASGRRKRTQAAAAAAAEEDPFEVPAVKTPKSGYEFVELADKQALVIAQGRRQMSELGE